MECLNFDLKMKSPGHLENGFFRFVYKAKQTVSLSLRTDDNSANSQSKVEAKTCLTGVR